MNIILIGFMGTGKSTVAPLVARKLNMEYVEMDQLIEKKAGKSIDEIFRDEGETVFREYEVAVARDLKNVNNAVVSCGGGVVMNKIIIDDLKHNGVVVGMFADFETIFKRVEGDLPRPLFKDRKVAEKLYNFRKPLYELYSDKKVNTDNKSVEEVAEEIVRIIEKKG
jgi:shikimate kinase